MPKEIPAFDAQTLALLKERRAMFSSSPSALPALHRRLRVAEMERHSLRAALRATLERVWEQIGEQFAAVSAPAGLGYAGAAAAVALALAFGIEQNRVGGDRMLTLGQPPVAAESAPAPAPSVQYAFNDAAALPSSTPDQRIDRLTSGQGSSTDLNQDSAQHAAGAHYILTSTPASYDSVVAF